MLSYTSIVCTISHAVLSTRYSLGWIVNGKRADDITTTTTTTTTNESRLLTIPTIWFLSFLSFQFSVCIFFFLFFFLCSSQTLVITIKLIVLHYELDRIESSGIVTAERVSCRVEQTGRTRGSEHACNERTNGKSNEKSN